MKTAKCDMRGFLSFMILWLLSKKSMHGQQLAAEIEKRRGERPKAGTLYPALKYLKSKGLIKGQNQGKLIVYSLTKSGRKNVEESMNYFCKAFGDIFKNHRSR
jgi:DNA-binding PadR family transcriptional regulator